MSFTEVKPNLYNFSEVSESDKQVLVTNNLGRDVVYGEFVYLDGYFGEVREYGGIVNGATGYININADRKIRTEQVEATDAFTAGSTLWFVSGGSGAAGKFVDADPGSGTRLGCGIITGEEGTGGAQTAVEFRPFVQRLDAVDVSAQVAVNTTAIGTLASLTTTEKTNLVGALNEVDADVGDPSTLTTTEKGSAVGAINEVDADVLTLQGEMLAEQAEPKKYVQKIVADASAGIALTGLSEGDEIIGVSIICTVAEASGTLKITDGSPADISDAIICAVDKVATYAGTIDDTYSTLPASGAVVIAAGGTAANIRGIVIVDYIPA